MTVEQIEVIQAEIGADVDGFWGPQSIGLCKHYLRSLMPHPSPWPVPTDLAIRAFYGQPGDAQLISIPAPVPMKYEGVLVKTLLCHKKVAASLRRCLILAHEASPRFVENYDGIYNYRPMRGGRALSLHSWGIAIDLSAETNGNQQHWPVSANMPFEVMKAFASEGWTPAGAFWGRDAMHFQATQAV